MKKKRRSKIISDKIMACVFCKKSIRESRGNNALPVAKGLCCDHCNIDNVLPVRTNAYVKVNSMPLAQRRSETKRLRSWFMINKDGEIIHPNKMGTMKNFSYKFFDD